VQGPALARCIRSLRMFLLETPAWDARAWCCCGILPPTVQRLRLNPGLWTGASLTCSIEFFVGLARGSSERHPKQWRVLWFGKFIGVVSDERMFFEMPQHTNSEEGSTSIDGLHCIVLCAARSGTSLLSGKAKRVTPPSSPRDVSFASFA